MDKKIKILFLIGSFGTGGKERQLAELIKGLDKSQFELHLLIKSEGAHYLEEMRDMLTSYKNLSRKHFGLRAIKEIRKEIIEIKPDIVHSWAETTSVTGILIKLFIHNQFKLIDGSIRMTEKNRTFKSKLQRSIINKFSDYLISNSRAGLEIYNVPSEKSCFVYNGYDLNRTYNLIDKDLLRHQLKIDNRFVIGMVARIDFQKDWDTFFQAALNLLKKRNDIVFVIVGDGDKRAYFESLISEKKSDFIFTGLVKNVESYINLFDIAVLSSYSEGISNSIMEYMAVKKPVIASGTGGVSELVKENETGLTYNIGEFVELGSLIIKLLDNPGLRDELGLNGYNFIKSHFTRERMIEKYTNCYKNLLCVA